MDTPGICHQHRMGIHQEHANLNDTLNRLVQVVVLAMQTSPPVNQSTHAVAAPIDFATLFYELDDIEPDVDAVAY